MRPMITVSPDVACAEDAIAARAEAALLELTVQRRVRDEARARQALEAEATLRELGPIYHRVVAETDYLTAVLDCPAFPRTRHAVGTRDGDLVLNEAGQLLVYERYSFRRVSARIAIVAGCVAIVGLFLHSSLLWIGAVMVAGIMAPLIDGVLIMRVARLVQDPDVLANAVIRVRREIEERLDRAGAVARDLRVREDNLLGT